MELSSFFFDLRCKYKTYLIIFQIFDFFFTKK